jgi:hypothetical protein
MVFLNGGVTDLLAGGTQREMKGYIKSKNAVSKPINWQFANEQARIKLKSLYSVIWHLLATGGRSDV